MTTSEAETIEPSHRFDATRARAVGVAVATALLLPLVLFVVVRPDWYYVQNGLDPFFYTGYAQNFTEIFYAAGDRHYFISRWTIYLPQRALLAVFDDPKAAFLLFRWAGAALIVASVLALGRRRWRRWDAVALVALCLLMPISIRALLTDYSDTVVFPAGTALIIILALRPDRWTSALAAGVLGGLMVVANPFALTVAAATTPFWLARIDRRRWAGMLALAAAGAVAVVAGGLLFFRWRYDVPNVYQPTLDFIRNRGTDSDPLKSPRLWWMGYRLWIFAPALVIAAYHTMRRWFAFEFGAVERAIVGTCTVQYAFQIWFQFARQGSTLEISYYWSYIVPSFLLAFCVVLGALAQRAGRRFLPTLAVLVAVALRLIGSPTPEVFQSWIDAAILLAVAAVAVKRATRLRPALSGSLLAVAILAVQTSAPRPEPILEGELRVASSYELAYEGDDSTGVLSFDTAVWFIEAMREVDEPVMRSSVFWYKGALPARLAATFGVQVSGKWLNPNWPTDDVTAPFPPDVVIAINQGNIPSVVVIGSAAEVDAVVAQLLEVEPRMTERLRRAAPGAVDVSFGVVSMVEATGV